jgi:hypothetical protein
VALPRHEEKRRDVGDRLLLTSLGPTQAGTTPHVAFSAAIKADGDVDLGVAL